MKCRDVERLATVYVDGELDERRSRHASKPR